MKKELIEINGKYYKKKTIRLWRIKITDDMKTTLPRVRKLQEKYSFYRKFKRFNSCVILNKHFVLVDGYITFLLARMFNMKKIEVLIEV